ncbi:histidine phosphatase family protein [Pyruvatibacter mobilis]|uniref:histidine phosphatase family protein n=1 Tax=Pyruvatibacter mobilis TaxID=1712261 RepID=UPI003BA8E0B7
MPRIYMIRHGKAAAGWGADADPGLDAEGQAQAEAVANEIVSTVGPDITFPLMTSPLKRCRETSMPLARHWSAVPVVEPAVSEIPSPTENLDERAQWLRRIMPGTWADIEKDPTSTGVDFVGWRNGLVDRLKQLEEDTVIFSHFIAINAAVGAALDDDRVVCFRPDNCSITCFDVTPELLKVVSLGREADTVVR